MKAKKALLCILTVIIMLVGAYLIARNIFGFELHFNIIKYHEESVSDYTLKYYGSFGEIRKIKIYKDGKKVCRADFDSSTDFFDNSDARPQPVDLNSDGCDDLLVPFLLDIYDDIHYAAFICVGTDLAPSEVLSDICNVKTESGTGIVSSEKTEKFYTEKPTENNPEVYEEKHSITEYRWTDGEFLAWSERAVTYYSETDYCCYSVREYDAEYGGLKYVSDKWFEPADMDKYPLK